MWIYDNYSEEEYLAAVKSVEEFAHELGAEYICTKNKRYTTDLGEKSVAEKVEVKYFKYKDQFFAIERHYTLECPMIVLSFGDSIDTTWEAQQPFPFNLSDYDLKQEVKYSMGIESYPKRNPKLNMTEAANKTTDVVFKGFVLFAGLLLFVSFMIMILGAAFGLIHRFF